MTLSVTQSRYEYNGDGSTVAFAFPAKFFLDADLKVYVDSTLQVITTNYTVSGAGLDAGGTVTFGTAPANGTKVIIYRDPAIKQETDYSGNDSFPEESHENALDLRTMISQRLADLISRSITLNDYVTGFDPSMPDPVADMLISIKADGTGLELVSKASATEQTVTNMNVSGTLIVGGTIAGEANAATVYTDGQIRGAYYTFSNNVSTGLPDTAIYRVTTNTIAERTSGVERRRVTSSGYQKISSDGAYTNYAGTDISATPQNVFDQSANDINIFSHCSNTGSGSTSFFSDFPSTAAGYHYRARLNGSMVMEVQADGDLFNTNGTYGTISDIKTKVEGSVKTNATNRTEELKQLRVVNYQLKNDEKGKKLIGFIAQEVEQVFPGMITENPDTETYEATETIEEQQLVVDDLGSRTETITREVKVTKSRETGETTKAVKTSLLIPILVQGFQEQQRTIEALKARIEALEKRA